MKKQHKEQNTAINLLSIVTNVTSGQLVLNNCWTLGPTVLQEVIEKADKEKEKQQNIYENKKKRATTVGNKFKASYHKYVNNKKLVAADYNNLLQKVCLPNNSPLRTKVSELQKQFRN
jgi:hypothetical protein